ncbi:hypothetical protein RND81_09G021100 [Saponaria officinalis]|uniref:Uncharacterized protein n=1 Tax=Saponaria officinalis TaxID=3572 RepID=A0AAW1IHR2_SAPOF
MQACKPEQAVNDQTNQPKTVQNSDSKSPEKRHHIASWLGRGGTEKKQQNEAKAGHRLTNWLGQGVQRRHYSENKTEDEMETIVINRKIKERVVITHAKKSTEHKDGEKHYTRC